jgi:hypothetical protein
MLGRASPVAVRGVASPASVPANAGVGVGVLTAGSAAVSTVLVVVGMSFFLV